MNREILFKAKRKDNSEWVEGYIFELQPCQYMICNEKEYGRSSTLSVLSFFEYCSHEIDPDTICQYTGLTDKNGLKIWENDICIIEDGTLDEEDGCFICKWDDYAARYILDGNGLIADFDNVDTRYVEVIGNIFDNADLLEVE